MLFWMEINKLEKELNRLGEKKLNIDLLLSKVEFLKKESKEISNEKNLNRLWVISNILHIHKDFCRAFNLLKAKKYNDGWVVLEQIEINISFLKRHAHLVSRNYKIRFIETVVQNLQLLFPYRLFGSTELLEKELKCNICGNIVTIRNYCGHIPGDIYMGEMCIREVTKVEFLGLAIVENPVNKYSVIFTEEDNSEIRDKVQFVNLNYILSRLKGPYDLWRVEIFERIFPFSSYTINSFEELCPCGRAKTYKECCMLRGGIHGFHYEFTIMSKTNNKKKK